MGQSRPRTSRRHLIINQPAQQSRTQRAMFGAITLACWAVWVYLWLPLITLAGWFGWGQRFGEVMIVQHGADNFVALVEQHGMTVLVLCGALVSWATIEWLRFRRGSRRRLQPMPVAAAELAAKLHRSATIVERYHDARRMVVTYNARGRLTRIDASGVVGPHINLDDLIKEFAASARRDAAGL